ncbi:xanthine dehydrogenase family protein subunit M [Anaerovorax odorimutans]|uniref:Xanthine dehydrogenase family protein subunit M n=1 Tax=Anaerovorax odorimutans TaxID=109327 RepID=A0ABT1RPF0_9FIRM|nr:xanthine dehydrogenase family protein subunit M [Anaerovorax odorimutans]MCQ4637044.1 xanthine dehydrogenase family protein subunit M [Anaerovorax odorimutans]
MALPNFDYIAAKSLREASELVCNHGERCVLMAGGTDVILLIKDSVLKDVDTVIDLKDIPELDRLEFVEGEGLKVGALTKLFTIQTSQAVEEKMPAVADAAHYVASAQIRRKGTMAGNICNASPSADTAPILLAMNAVVKTYSKNGGRTIPIDDFFTGVKKTCLKKEEGEIVTEIDIPELKAGEGSAYFKHAVRKAMDLAIIGSGAWVKMDGNKIAGCRIAMGGVGVTPLRAKKAEQFLIGGEATEERFAEAGVIASGECSPISDVRASAEYRSDMIRVFTKRALKKAVETLA